MIKLDKDPEMRSSPWMIQGALDPGDNIFLRFTQRRRGAGEVPVGGRD